MLARLGVILASSYVKGDELPHDGPHSQCINLFLQRCILNVFFLLQGFVQNQARARNLQDVSVLPDLCTSHRRQLSLMLKNHQSLQDIHRRCAAAKDELSANLHARLRSLSLSLSLSVSLPFCVYLCLFVASSVYMSAAFLLQL